MAKEVACSQCKRKLDPATMLLRDPDWWCIDCFKIQVKGEFLQEERSRKSKKRKRRTNRANDKRCKLSDEQIRKIKELAVKRVPFSEIAARFKVTRGAIYYHVFPDHE